MTEADRKSARRVLHAMEFEAAARDVSPAMSVVWTQLAANVRRELFTGSPAGEVPCDALRETDRLRVV